MIIKVLFFSILRSIFAPNPSKEEGAKNLLVIRIDAIGDYVLFRNFLEVLRNSEKYSVYKITLCGNELWKDLFESFDKDFVDDVIWVNTRKLRRSPFYIYRKLAELRRGNFSVAVNPMYSRTLESDLLINATGAIERIGWVGTENNMEARVKEKTDKWYTKLFDSDNKYKFEFYRNREFFEKIFEKKIDIKKPFFEKIPEYNIELLEKFTVLFPGASSVMKQWSPENFIKVSNLLIKRYFHKIIVAGGIMEKDNAISIISANKDHSADLAGSTTLAELVYVISRAKLLISNDTSAVHIAVSLNIPTVCISNGITFGRFTSYPKEIFDKIEYVYPNEVEKNSIEENFEKYSFDSELDINTIEPEKVEQAIERLLK